MPEELYAEVLVEIPGIRPEKTFQYRVPAEMAGVLRLGYRVRVPFGGRKVTGFVVGTGGDTRLAGEIKDILELASDRPLFDHNQLALARWMASYYFCDTVKALQAIIAPVLNKVEPAKRARYYYSAGEINDLRQVLKKRAPKSLAVLEAAMMKPGLSRAELAAAGGASESVVDRLAAKKMLRVAYEPQRRDPYPDVGGGTPAKQVLTGEQERAVAEITGSMQKGHGVVLLHGVTGSGKTEVYLRCIEAALAEGRQSITMVPEISLTPQMVKLFKERFGELVAVLHSRMSDGERHDEWTRVEEGTATVVLGTRSAVLAPVKDPGLIIIDEEHEWSYKQEETPRYHARVLALHRAQKNNGVLVLGSATPSLESYCRALPGGSYKLVDMKQRIEGRPLPRVGIIDMRAETRAGNGGIFSRHMMHMLADRLNKNDQSIIFLNRRGFNTLVVCRECGLVVKCPRCDISLTYHIDFRLRCHYCNYSIKAPRTCPECGGREIGYFGAGTQRVERELRAAFPGARILRMDADTTRRKGSHRDILEAFSEGKADILVGTQMIAKGLDITGVTLVGVVNADITLHMPDFRAAERTFQLLAQVSGRTGRGDKRGEVLIQTYNPEHYAIRAAAKHDYHGFFNKEFGMRKAMGYPPFSKMVRFLVYGEDENAVRQAAVDFRETIDGFTGAHEGDKIFIAGPAPAPVSRLKNKHRWHIIIWSRDYKRLRLVMEDIRRATGFAPPGKGLHLSVDVDPMSMM